jgi:hypothetical protein
MPRWYAPEQTTVLAFDCETGHPEEGRGDPINWSDADEGDLVPRKTDLEAGVAGERNA